MTNLKKKKITHFVKFAAIGAMTAAIGLFVKSKLNTGSDNRLSGIADFITNDLPDDGCTLRDFYNTTLEDDGDLDNVHLYTESGKYLGTMTLEIYRKLIELIRELPVVFRQDHIEIILNDD